MFLMSKNVNSDIKKQFEEYLENNWWDVNALNNVVKRFSLNLFDIFFDWILSVKKDSVSNKQAFFYISNKIKNLDNTNYFENKTYRSIENLFINFVNFCEKNNDVFNLLFLEKYWSKFENKLTWEFKIFIEKWHNYLINDTWENKNKFCEYLADIYESLGIDDYEKLFKFYTYIFNAHKILSEISSRNKEIQEWKLVWKKQKAFDIAFDYLCKKLSELRISDKKWEVKSIFGKYLHFVLEYRKQLSKTLSVDTKGANTVKKQTEQNVWENLTGEWAIPWNYWYEWDWFWPKEIREILPWVWVVTKRGDVQPPDEWVFGKKINVGWVWPDRYDWEALNNTGDNNSWVKKKNRKKNLWPELNFDLIDSFESISYIS